MNSYGNISALYTSIRLGSTHSHALRPLDHRERVGARTLTGRSLSARRPSGHPRLHPTGALVRTKLAQLRLDTLGCLAATVAVGLQAPGGPGESHPGLRAAKSMLRRALDSVIHGSGRWGKERVSESSRRRPARK